MPVGPKTEHTVGEGRPPRVEVHGEGELALHERLRRVDGSRCVPESGGRRIEGFEGGASVPLRPRASDGAGVEAAMKTHGDRERQPAPLLEPAGLRTPRAPARGVPPERVAHVTAQGEVLHPAGMGEKGSRVVPASARATRRAAARALKPEVSMSAPLILDARFLASATQPAQLPPPLVAEVAFAGRSNVGKSSLINRLVARKKLVRTSSTPGCTRGINVFRVGVRLPDAAGADADAEIDLVDLPGYGYARRSKAERRSWGPLIEGFLRERPGLRGVVIIIDVRRGLEDDDLQLLEFVRSIDRRPLLVATKLDKLPKNERKLALAAVGAPVKLRVHGFSSETGEGRDALWRSILRAASVGPVAG